MSKRRYLLYCILAGMLWLPASVMSQADGLSIHVVQRGETLYRIAMEYGLPVTELAQLNGIQNVANIQVGQRLLVPVLPGHVTMQAAAFSHVVQPGETLRSIAELYNIETATLAELNSIDNPDAIYVGQALSVQIAPQSAPAQPVDAPAVVAEEGVASQPSAIEEPDSLIYVVQRGESLFQIATGYGLTVNDLVQANNLVDPTRIYPGQQLVIPGVEVPSLAFDLPDPVSALKVMPQTLIEGQTVRFQVTTTVPATVQGYFLGYQMTSLSEQGDTFHTMLQGIPLFTEAGVYPLELDVTDNTGKTQRFTANLQVTAGVYGQETITLLADRGGLLDPVLDQSETDLVARIMSPVNTPRLFDGPMSLPAAATVISRFGTRRSYNGGPFDRYHAGTDFAGVPGTPIMATAPGRVVLVDALNVRGNATIIDHGGGVYTGYWHQTDQYVSLGDMVETRQVIGTIGSTGRVTGAHLHWEVWVGGVPVDPMQWVRQSFS
jgi:murein DD-endopeptidase MepM/ murein hydrolase activator NlpD